MFIDVRVLHVPVAGHHWQKGWLRGSSHVPRRMRSTAARLWETFCGGSCPVSCTANLAQVTLVCRMVQSKCVANQQDIGNDWHLLVWAADLPPPQRPQRLRPHAENIFGSGNGGHRYTWLIIEKGESCSSSWGSVWEVEFKQTNPINRQIAHLHIYVLLAKLKPGIMLTGTSKAPQKRALVHRSVAQGRKIAGRCRWSCKSIRSGLGEHWHERRPLYWSALVEIAAPCCPWIFPRIQLRFCANSNNRRSIENIQPLYIYIHINLLFTWMYIRTYK